MTKLTMQPQAGGSINYDSRGMDLARCGNFSRKKQTGSVLIGRGCLREVRIVPQSNAYWVLITGCLLLSNLH